MNIKTFLFKIKLASLVAIPLIFSLQSCISNKDYIYLQNKDQFKSDSSEYFTVKQREYQLKPGDILYIKLITEDEKMNALFNPLTSGTMNMQLQQLQGTGTPFYIMGYSLNSNCELELPYIGKIDLRDKTLEQTKHLLEVEIKKYFKNFFLQVKLAEFRFSILGSVNRPGQYFFMINKLNIFEAIAMAGDVNEIAKRNELTLIREKNGKTTLHKINLTDKNILNSEYYYILPNDLIYVAPVKSRSIGNLSSLQNTVSAILPIFSTFLLVLNTYIILQNIK